MSEDQSPSKVPTHFRGLAQYLAQEGHQIIVVPQALTFTTLTQGQSSTDITRLSAETKATSPGLALPASPSIVDLKSLKRLVSQLLPASSPVRSLILSEKDRLPAEEAFVKFGVYDRLLWNELNS